MDYCFRISVNGAEEKRVGEMICSASFKYI